MNNQYKVSANSKKQGSIISIIILVVVVIIGLAGYIVYDKVLSDTNADTNTEENEQEYNNKEENINEEEETTEEELDVNSAVVRDLMSMIQEPLNKAMIYDFYLKQNIKANDLSNYSKLLIGLAYLSKDGLPSEFSSDEMSNAIKAVLGNDTMYTNESFYSYKSNFINSSCSTYEYSAQNRMYTETLPGGCGGSMGSTTPYGEVVRAVKFADKIEIYEKFIVNENGSVYTGAENNKVGLETPATYSSDKTYYDKYFDELYSVKYTFVKNGNNYSFSSSEIVK